MDKENCVEVPFHCSITVIHASGNEGKSFTFDSKNWCVLGSHPDCDIRIKHNNSAPLHALVFVREDGVHLQGIHPEEPVIHSRSAKSLIKEEELSLQPGDVFFLGERGFRVEFEKLLQSPPKSLLQPTSQTVDTPITTMRGADNERKARRRSQSARKAKPKRRVSLVVERHGERFVARKGDSEKLLSRSQLARLSGGEGFHKPGKVVDHENESSSCIQLSASETSTSTETGTASSNEMTDLSSFIPTESDGKRLMIEKLSLPRFQHTEGDTQANNASSIESRANSEPIESERRDSAFSVPHTPTNTKVERMAKSATKLSARDRKNLVYARLSQGLSAIPRKSEVIDSTTTVAFSTPSVGFNEHVAQNDSLDHKSNSKVNRISKSPIRSPLVDKSPLLNIQQGSKLRGSIKKECRTPSLLKKTPASVLRSSKSTTKTKSRSVAFAARIELERGTHYSPFRSKQFPRTPVPKQEPAVLSRVASKKSALSSTDQPPKPMALKQISNEFEANEGVVNGSSLSGCQDDTVENQVLKQRAEAAAECTALSEPEKLLKPQQEASTSSFKGVITSFIKRLSGNMDDDSDESDKSVDEQSSGARDSRSTASTDAVMTPTEIAHFTGSNRMSTTRRLSFFDKVLGAAAAMRQVTEDTDPSDSCASSMHEVQIGDSSPTASSANHDEGDPTTGADMKDFLPTSERGGIESHTSLERTPDGDHSSIEENHSNEMLPKTSSPLNKAESHEGIFQKLTHGMDGEESECNEPPLDQTSDHSDETESIGFSSDDSDSLSSQGTADTFERELEIAVTQGSAPSQHTPSVSIDPNQELAGDEENVSETDFAAQECQDEMDIKTHEQREDDGPDEEANDPIPESTTNCVMKESNRTTLAQKDHGHCQPLPPPGSTSEVGFHRSVQRKTRRSGRLNPLATSDQLPTEGNDIDHPPNRGSDQHVVNENDFTIEDACDKITLQTSLNKLLVVDLRKRLRERNLSTAGKKAELVNRLVAHLLLTPSSSEETKSSDETNAVELGEMDKDLGSAGEEMREATVIKCVSGNQEDEAETTVVESSDGELDDQTAALEKEHPNGKQIPDDDENANGGKHVIIDAYRRKTVKELRNILKEKNLDIMSKLRKEELIHHMISLNVRLDDEGSVESIQTPRPERVLRSTRSGRHTPAASRAPKITQPLTAKAVSKLTVSELRTRLADLDLCQFGTKKTLAERLMSGLVSPDMDLAEDNSVCDPCRAGQDCEGGTAQTR